MPRQDYDKIVKLACKPKNAPPKQKYLDADASSLISATFDEAALNDITRSLSMRLRDTNPVVVFKALIVLHQLMRSGASESLLKFLSRSDVLRLRNVQATPEGPGPYHPPSNMGTYAYYLDTRIRSFRDLKHDLVYLQTESNRRSSGLGANSKARRLRHLPVDKGLLREVKQVQRILDALIRCTFYDDDLRDENTVLAFRMLIKDLLVLFQAGNEGVCNILEHYFEMSKVDATEAFEIYKSFIKQTDKVVDYLAIARRLNNVVNVPVPNLKHAPTSLVKALEEYLNDPNFEQNRIDYKKSLGVVEGRSTSRSPAPKDAGKDTGKKEETKSEDKSKTPQPPAPVANAQQKIQDFLDSIETEQHGGTASSTIGSSSMGPGVGGSMSSMSSGMMGMGGMPMNQFGQMPMQMQMTGGPNPFRQSSMGFMGPQMTGFPGAGGGFMQPQQTGFLQPQTTGFQQQPQTGFLQPSQTGGGLSSQSQQRQGSLSGQGQQQQQMFGQPQSPQSDQHKQTSLLNQPNHNNPFPGMQSQQTGMQSQPTGFLMPQSTGSNPFRQSMMQPQGTGMGGLSLNTNLNGMPGMSGGGMSAGGLGMNGMNGSFSQSHSPFGGQQQPHDYRPGSTPAGGAGGTTSPKPLTAQKTGSNNPFAPPGGIPQPAPQQPKQPSMNELQHQRFQNQFAMSGGLNPTQTGMGTHPQQQQQQQSQQSNDPWNFDPLSSSTSSKTQGQGGSAMGDIASAFAMDKPGSKSSTDDFFTQFSTMSMGSDGPSPSPGAGLNRSATTAGFLQPQRTGFGGSTVKPFKPSSNFGTQLADSLPPIPEPSFTGGPTVSTPDAMGATPGSNGVTAQSTGFPFGAPSGNGTPNAMSPGGNAQGVNSQATGFQSAFGQQFNTNTGGANGTPGGLNTQTSGFQPSSAFGQQFSPGGAGANGASSGAGGLSSQPTGFQPTSSFGQQLASQHPAPLQRQNTGSNPFHAMSGGGAGGAFNPQTAGATAGPFGAGSPFAGQNAFAQPQRQASLF